MEAIWAAIVGAAVAAAVSIYLAWRAHQENVRERRRATYSEAYKAAMGWVEMVYRVRRRSNKEDPKLVELFHERQEAITYFQGWIATESEVMGRAYRDLVDSLRGATEKLLQEAWASDPAPPWASGHGKGPRPDCQGASDKFLKQVRDHLSS
ncbi:MAG TPA: hypothetical protein VMV09_05295 [Candidatus Saccharimonadales bacterium]|nr:hypothetical protein [Candidatus Saccharimonadales bacterium]